jgi:KDO2-lipid IV(A) lauroyltransferase
MTAGSAAPDSPTWSGRSPPARAASFSRPTSDTGRWRRAGGIVDILLDQKTDLEHSVIVDFLGIPTPTTPSLARIALADGVPVVPLFSYPAGTGYEFALEPAILPESGDNVTTLTQRYNDSVSRHILARPELWFWFHDRWTPRRRRAADA